MKVPVRGLRDLLLDHAVAMLEGGDPAPGIRALARAAGVSAMAPYRHFADRAALLAAVADHGFALLAEALVRADERGSDAERLVEQGLAYVTFARAHPALFRLMFTRSCAASVDPHGTAFATMADRVAAVTGGAVPDAALGCWAIVHGLATLAIDGGVTIAPAQARAILTFHVAGIAAR